MNVCHVCRTDNGQVTYPDPCCGAPDCDGLTNVVHYRCASPSVQREIRFFELGESDYDYDDVEDYF